MPEGSGEKFLSQKYRELHKTKEVKYEQKRKKRAGEKVTQKPAEQIGDFIKVLEKTHLSHRDDPKVMDRIKSYYHKEHVIKAKDIPQSYWDAQAKIMINEGRGGDLDMAGIEKKVRKDKQGKERTDYIFPENLRDQNAEVIIADQKSTLDNWTDYFTSPDADFYPMWAKYWAFNNMLKLSTYDKEKKRFGERRKDTVAPFPDLNREALAYVVDTMIKKYGPDYFKLQEEIQQAQRGLKKVKSYEGQQKIIESGEDAKGRKLPAKRIEKMRQGLEKPEHDRKYYESQLASLQKKQKELFKIGADQDETSKELWSVLKSEDFSKLYAYAIEKVTPAKEHELKNTAGKWIKYDQNSDHMPLVESLQGHGTGWCTAGEETAKSQLQDGDFHVYYSNDQSGTPNVPRVAIRMDQNSIAEVRGIAPDQNLDPYIADVADQKLDRFPDGKQYKQKVADMKQLTEIDKTHQAGGELTKEDLKFLYELDDKIEGFGYKEDPRIEELLEDRDLKEDIALVIGCSPEQISTTKEEVLGGNIKYHHGDLNLFDLTSAEGLELPESVGGYLDLQSLTSAEGLTFPDNIEGNLYLNLLTSAEGLKLPENIEGNLDLQSLISAEGLTFSKSIKGHLWLQDLKLADGLVLPKNIEGNLVLKKLQTAKGLKLPVKIGGGLDLRNLVSTEELFLPEKVGGALDLRSIISSEGLKFPEVIKGSLMLSKITTANNLYLPKIIKGHLWLQGLTSIDELTLPSEVTGNIILDNIPPNEKEELRKRYPDLDIR